jgi:hypothetical protein
MGSGANEPGNISDPLYIIENGRLGWILRGSLMAVKVNGGRTREKGIVVVS